MGSWKRLTKPRFLFVYPVAAALLLMSHITEASLRVGLVFLVLGQAVRLWANGYVGHQKVNVSAKTAGSVKIGRLTTAGPYTFVRHPLYLGTLLIGTGFCVVVGYPWVSLAAFAGFCLAYHAKMLEEERTLRDECGADYDAYHAAVPRLLPFRRPYPHRHGRWAWQGIAASKEWKTVIWVSVAFVALYFWEELMQEHGTFFGAHGARHVALAAAAVGLAAVDGLSEWCTRRMQPPARSTAAA